MVECRTCYRESENLTSRLTLVHGNLGQDIHTYVPPKHRAISFDTHITVAMHPRRRLRSSSTDQLIVPSHRLSTVGARAFPVAGAYTWNGLPADVTSAPSTAGVQTTPEESSVPPQLSEHMCYLNFVFPSLTVVLAVFFILRPL